MKRVFKIRISIPCFAILMWYVSACNQPAHRPGVQPAIIAQLDTSKYTTINWKDTMISFGTIREGDTVRGTFNFTNTGTKPLFISDVRPSCGCTVADYPQEAIAPGHSGSIRTAFGTGWHPGAQVKLLVVKTNTRPKTNSKLVLRGEVIPKQKK
jgi:hypothetical protein